MNTNRRTFLINVAKGGLALSSLPLLTSCGGITRSDLNYGTNSAELQQVIGKEGVEILHLASLAPNGHNTQPWTVTIVDPIIGLSAQIRRVGCQQLILKIGKCCCQSELSLKT